MKQYISPSNTVIVTLHIQIIVTFSRDEFILNTIDIFFIRNDKGK